MSTKPTAVLVTEISTERGRERREPPKAAREQRTMQFSSVANDPTASGPWHDGSGGVAARCWSGCLLRGLDAVRSCLATAGNAEAIFGVRWRLAASGAKGPHDDSQPDRLLQLAFDLDRRSP